jgi:hypothetical protein
MSVQETQDLPLLPVLLQTAALGLVVLQQQLLGIQLAREHKEPAVGMHADGMLQAVPS